MYVLGCTCMYQNILVHTKTSSMTSTYQYIPVHICMYTYIQAHTSTYQYIPVHTRVPKKVQTGLEPVILCMQWEHFPATLKACTDEIRDIQMSVFGMYIYFCSYICLCTWLFMTDRQRRTSSASAACHHGSEDSELAFHDSPCLHCNSLGHVQCACGRRHNLETGRYMRGGRCERVTE